MAPFEHMNRPVTPWVLAMPEEDHQEIFEVELSDISNGENVRGRLPVMWVM